MPVVWNTASCEPPTPTNDLDMMWRGCLVDVSGVVGLSRITEDNVDEWLWRLAFVRRILGKDIGCLVFHRKGEFVHEPATPAVVRRWVGLWTNWSNSTRPAFVKRWVEDLERDCDRAVASAKRDEEEAKQKPVRAKKRRRVKA